LALPLSWLAASSGGDFCSQVERYLYDSVVTWRTLIFFGVLAGLALYLANPLGFASAVSERYATEHVYVYCAVCGLLAAFTVTSSKIISSALIKTYYGNASMFTQPDIAWLTYVFFVVISVSGLLQVHFLNKAMRVFESTEVIPTFYIVLTTVVVLTGMVMFMEVYFSPLIPNAALFGVGLLLAYTGINLKLYI